MAAIDFITALGRLLRDGALRDAFALDPAGVARRLELAEAEWPAFQRLVPADLEFQARVLLKKRFDVMRRVLPRTLGAMGAEAWPEFLRYGRTNLCDDDAAGFCEHVERTQPAALCPLERNRLRFLRRGPRLALHIFLRMPVRTSFRPGLQLFIRGRGGIAHEWRLDLTG